MANKVILWGGIGEKKSNKGTQFYIQDRVYDSNGIACIKCIFSILDYCVG